MFRSVNDRISGWLDKAAEGNRLAIKKLDEVSSRDLMKCSDETLKRFTDYFEAQAEQIRESTRLMLAH